MSNSLIAGYTTNNENRTDPGKLFPFVDILAPDGTTYASFGTEPFTPNNELLYQTYQLQDNLTKFSSTPFADVRLSPCSGTRRENSFFNCCKQGAYVYNSLADFYADANGFLANPNRTTSPITPRRYQVRWMNMPGLDKPLQNLNVWNAGRLRPGRVAATREPDAHGRRQTRHPGLRQHRRIPIRTPTR